MGGRSRTPPRPAISAGGGGRECMGIIASNLPAPPPSGMPQAYGRGPWPIMALHPAGTLMRVSQACAAAINACCPPGRPPPPPLSLAALPSTISTRCRTWKSRLGGGGSLDLTTSFKCAMASLIARSARSASCGVCRAWVGRAQLHKRGSRQRQWQQHGSWKRWQLSMLFTL